MAQESAETRLGQSKDTKMADHLLPTTTTIYTEVLAKLKERIDDSLKMLDSLNTTPTNVPTNAVRWNATTFLWEKYNGTAWVSLAASYAIQVLKSTNLMGGNNTTLLGSIPYQSNTNITTLLAPNTTATRKFLRMLGTGSNGAIPVWDAILAADIPTLNQNTTGSSGSCTGISAKATNLVGGNSTTLLGSIHYQSNTDTTTLLAPNITTVPKVLMMTGTGTNGGTPAWTAIEDRLGTPIVSAATTTIGTAGLGDYIHITGTATITSFGIATTAGIRRTLIFDGALTLTHNATSLICMGGSSFTTVAGLVIEVVAETTANWRIVSMTHPNISVAELRYLDGVTSSIQTQLGLKAPSDSPVFTGNARAVTPAMNDTSTSIATTEFVRGNALYEYVGTYTLTNLATGFPVEDADFILYSSMHIIPSKAQADGALQSFSWTIPNHATWSSFDSSGATTTRLYLYSLYPLTVTKNGTDYTFYINGNAGGKEYTKYTNISGTPVLLNALVARDFNSMNGQTVDVYGIRKNTFAI